VAGCASSASSAGHPGRGAPACHALTLDPDHLMGAGQSLPRRAGLSSPSETQPQTVEGSGHIKVQFANSPPGIRVGAKASGLFKSVELDRGRAMSDPTVR